MRICPIVQSKRLQIFKIGRLDKSAFGEQFEIKYSKLDRLDLDRPYVSGPTFQLIQQCSSVVSCGIQLKRPFEAVHRVLPLAYLRISQS